MKRKYAGMYAKHFRPTQKIIRVFAVIVFAVVGVAILTHSHAAAPIVSVEAENGSLSGNGTIATDATASAGHAVLFGASGSSVPSNGMLTKDPSFFPIAVWDQTPESNGATYKAIGINVFAGLYNGVTQSNLNTLQSNGLRTLADQDAVALSSPLSTTVAAWLPYDEPDNAQANSSGGYDPCIPTSTLQNTYDTYKAADTTKRPVMLGFGRGVADTGWVGRGTCSGQTSYYSNAKNAADLFAFDVYPVNDGLPLYYVSQGVTNLLGWTGGVKPVWADIETTDFGSTQGPTPAQTKYEVWSAIIHGATGIDYFAHIFTPTFNEAGLLASSSMSSAVSAINSQISSLATVINTGTIVGDTVTSSAGSSVPVDTLTKSSGGSTYIIAAAMRGASTTATYHPSGISSATVTVLGENRTIALVGGSFTDSFSGYDVHIYKITP